MVKDKIKRELIKSLLKQRKPFSNKGDYGHALIIAGQKGYMGAAVIAAKAALRSGAGLLTISVPSCERFILQIAVPEAMITIREEIEPTVDKFSAAGVGPGLGTDKNSEELLLLLLRDFKKPILLDADALNMISANKQLLSKIPAGTIITPHTIEFDRLFGTHENNLDRIDTAVKKAKELNIVIVLKGHETAVISYDKILCNTTGNAGLAKGGSGDALTGVITSFLAQGYSPVDACIIGVYLHGLAADLSLKKQSMESMLITDVINHFGNAFKEIRK